MVMFSESKVGSHSWTDSKVTVVLDKVKYVVAVALSGSLTPSGELPILEVPFTFSSEDLGWGHSLELLGPDACAGHCTLQPRSPLLCSRLGSVGQEEPKAAAQDPGELLGWSVKATGLPVGSTEVLWATSPSLQGPHFHRRV